MHPRVNQRYNNTVLYRADRENRNLLQGPFQSQLVFDAQENIHLQKEIGQTNTKDKSLDAYLLEHARHPKQKNADHL